MPANAQAVHLTDAEIAERKRMLRSLGLGPKPDTRGDATSRRKPPLGLAPAPGADDDAPTSDDDDNYGDREAQRIVGLSIARLSEEALARPLTVRESFDALEAALAATLDGDNAVYKSAKKRDADLTKQIETLKAELIETKHQVRELLLVQESMRIANRSERGCDGARGVPGRDGLQGPIGPRGERGDTGKAAPTIVSWAIDDAAFSATPILSDGGNGAVLHLRGMFEEFNEQINAADDDAERDAARAQRDAVEREVRAQGR
jgi:hypothetical protein